ncbi:unnamed protein product [Rhizophagus irregularis]|nr:unnamed protein product [Rhizophagus irregularis]
MTNECENLFLADNHHEVVEKLETGFNKLNNKFVNLLEENQRIKQQYENLQEKSQEILYINSELNEKYQEILRVNSDLNKKNQEILCKYSNLKVKLQAKDEQIEKLQKDLNLEKQKNKEFQRLEIISQNLEKKLKILEVDEIDINTINTFKEDSEQKNCNINDNPTTFDLNNNKSLKNDIKVVVGLDFGVRYTGFSYCYVNDTENICSNNIWHGKVGQFKTNSVLQYDYEYNNVVQWGTPALVKNPKHWNRKQNNESCRPIELFKLYIGNLSDNLNPKLPVEYKKVISDYFREIGKEIKDAVAIRCPNIDYFENVLLVITVPAEFADIQKGIIRKCAFHAELIKEECSTNLQFTTESEAAAIYCMKNFKCQLPAQSENNVMIVDCGSSIVNLTTLKFKSNTQFGEITKKAKDFCGSSFIDDEFIKYLQKILGDEPMNLLKDNNYGQMQYLIQHFFTVLDQYITNEEIRESLNKNNWIIEIDFKIMKSIYEIVIQKILHLIKVQLNNTHEICSAMFLVGGFSESKYLQERIKQEFQSSVRLISVPTRPITAVAQGAVIYGLFDLENKIKVTRVVKYTYGILERVDWKEGDLINRKTHDGKIYKFKPLVRRGTFVAFNQIFSFKAGPFIPCQIIASYSIYYTQSYEEEYCDGPGMRLFGKVKFELPADINHDNRSISVGLIMGEFDVTAFAENDFTGQKLTTLSLCLSDDYF